MVDPSTRMVAPATGFPVWSSELQFQKAELEKRRMMLEMESRESVEQLDKEQQMMYKRIYRKNRE